MFEKCKFLDEKLNDVDCSVERDTRDYVGEKLAIWCSMFFVFFSWMIRDVAIQDVVNGE